MSLLRRVVAERRVVVVPLVTALVINLLVFGLTVLPLARSVAGDEQRARDVKLALADAHRVARIANETKSSQEQADQELQTFYADVLPASLAEARSLLYPEVAALARETGLRHSTSVFSPESVEGSPLVRYRTDVSLSGDYAGVRRFLYLLETSEHFFVVESVRLGQSSSGLQGGGSLEIVLQLATYYSRAAAAGAGQ